ncbi:MAG: aldehyde ferredoxin oxidoreductase [Thermoanaerobacteraceae bacterium]|nr:aldehyde ferredoxin oxidoreductase [Thermoanaerobacteraceae bacterium]
MSKIIRVNMNSLSVTAEEVPQEYRCLGGRGLTSTIISREVLANCHPLGAENKVVIAPGLLTGTKAPCSGRMSIGAKSPLTGGIKESNVGGTAGQALARLGIKALVIEGKPEEGQQYLLEIGENRVRLQEARDLQGKTNYEVGEYLTARYGKGAAYISIGPGGEKQLSVASVAVGDLEGRPTRHAGRGGMGAVLGSKGIKAIVITRQGQSLKPANEAKFNEVVKSFAGELADGKKALTNYGTAVLVNAINKVGALPVNNFRYGTLEEAEKISGETLAQNCAERRGKTGHGCHRGCVIRCSNIYHDANGNYITAALEYETIVLLGSNCGLTDLDRIAQLDYMCDNYGLDTMETGAALAVAMEAGVLEFGDFKGMQRLIGEMVQGTLLGKLLGQGAYVTGKVLNVDRIPAVKGQSLSAYDPRGLKGTGVTYATSPMGADHTAGNCLPGRTGLDDRIAEGQIAASREIQVLSTICDNLGLCIFVGPVKGNLETMTKLFNYMTGNDYSPQKLMELGESIIKKEVAFNEKAGISKYQNNLPEFFRTEELHSGLVFDVDEEELAAIFA